MHFVRLNHAEKERTLNPHHVMSVGAFCLFFVIYSITSNHTLLKPQLWYYCRRYISHTPSNYINVNFIISLWSSLSNEQLSIFAVIISQLSDMRPFCFRVYFVKWPLIFICVCATGILAPAEALKCVRTWWDRMLWRLCLLSWGRYECWINSIQKLYWHDSL